MMDSNLDQLQGEFYNSIKSKGLSLNTQKNYKTDLDCFNYFLSSNKVHDELNRFELPQMLEYGKYLDQKYKSDNSRRRRVQSLRVFFDFLVQKGLYNSNPVRKVPTSPKFIDIPRPTPFDDIFKLWNHLEASATNEKTTTNLIVRRNQVIFLLVYGAGLRVSDLKDLKQSHIFLDETPRVLVSHSKRDPYTIPLPPNFVRVYTSYMKLFKILSSSSQIDIDQVLFNANHFKILSGGIGPRGLEIVFKELREKLDLTLTPKSLRQSCIFTWLGKNVPESLIKEWLGVAPSYTLQRYINHQNEHLYNDSFLEAGIN